MSTKYQWVSLGADAEPAARARVANDAATFLGGAALPHEALINGAITELIAASTQVAGSGSLPGTTVVPGAGVVGDGVTDDGPALSALAASLSAGGTIYFTPGKTYRLATAITTPAGVTLWTPNGTTLKVDGVVVTIQGPVNAGLWPVFVYANGGTVVFSTTNFAAGSTRVSSCPAIYPEWWGATGDNAHDDTAAIQATIDATTGYPITGLTTTRYAGPEVVLSAGSYRTTRAIHALDVVGLRVRGAGQSNTYIVFDGGETGVATAGTTTTLVNSGKIWPVNKWSGGDWFLYIYGGTGAGQYAQISSNTATVLTLASALTTAPDTTSTYAIVIRAPLLLNGVFASQFEGFQITGLNGYWKHGVVYYRDPATSPRGSSQCRFTNVSILLGYTDSGWQFGGGTDLSADTGFQADLCTLIGCQAFGQSATSGLYGAQVGFRFGDAQFANALNYTALGCEAVGNKYNVAVAATNVAWYGGTIQTAWGADIFVNAGLQGYSVFDGFRSEGSRMLLDSVSPQSVAWAIKISNVAFTMDAYQGNRLVSWRCGGGVLTLENIRTATPSILTGTASAGSATTLIDSTKTFATATITYADGQATVGLAGWDIQITGGTGNGQRRQITSNTATTITVPAWTVTPDATSQYQIMPRTPVVVENLAPNHVAMNGCQFTATPLEQFVQTGLAGGTWDAALAGCAELDANGTAILGSTAPNAGALYFTSGTRSASIGFGAAATVPDTRITRVGVGQVGIPGLVSSTAHVKATGTTPTGAATASGGSTSYNYKLVASDGVNKALPSAVFSVATGPATLSPSAFVRIALPALSEPAATCYDILKDDGTGTFRLLAGAVPWYLFQGGFIDLGQPLTAYTPPATDATGTLAVDTALWLGMTTTAATPGTVVKKFPVYDASGALLGYVPIYNTIT